MTPIEPALAPSGSDRDLTGTTAPAEDAETEAVRSGPELDEARTAPIALVRDPATTDDAVPERRTISAQHVLQSGALLQIGAILAVIGVLAGITSRSVWPVLLGGLLGTGLQISASGGWAALRTARGPVGEAIVPRLALVLVVAFAQPGVLTFTASTLLAIALLSEPVIARIARMSPPVAVHLEGVAAPHAGRLEPARGWFVSTVLALGSAVAASSGVAPLVLLMAAAVGAVVTLLISVQTTRAFREVQRARAVLATAVEAYAPRFALHWDAPPGTEYQVTMWLPYLERIGERFIVIVRNPRSFSGVARATDVPVILRQDPRDLDSVVAPSLRAVFYVNNAARNTHLVRFTGLVHVQLNHGESDKAPSYSPVFRLYDKDFVAGRAAIDRFAKNRVPMPDELFTIVGRPQVEHVLVGSSTTTRRTALYAPTWGGANADSDYCSLPIGGAIVRALIERGFDVIFRPHPYTRRNPLHAKAEDDIHAVLAADQRASGRQHRFGAPAKSADLIECFNAADLLVSDVSSVVPDFLYSEKPFAVVAMQGPTADFPRTFPIARAAYVLDRHGHNLGPVLDRMISDDPRAPARRDAKRYFLGDLPAEDYAGVFVREARKVVLSDS